MNFNPLSDKFTFQNYYYKYKDKELMQQRLIAEIAASQIATKEHGRVNEKLRKTNEELYKRCKTWNSTK